MPPDDEQLQIAALLDSIDARKKEIDLLKKYKSAIVSDVVLGRIDVRDAAIQEYEAAGEMAMEGSGDGDTCSSYRSVFNENWYRNGIG